MRAALYLLVVAGIAACGHATQTGPAWPAPSTTTEDGGESLEPRPSSTVAAAIEESDEPEEKAADTADVDDKDADTAAPAKDDDSSSTSTSESTSDEPMMTDEIIIEIED